MRARSLDLMADMAAAPPGAVVHAWAYVLYADEELWHQRLLMGILPGSSATRFLVCTPDFDIYVEDLGVADGDVAAVRLAAERWPPPPGLDRERCYRFAREPTGAQRERFYAAARQEAEATLTAEGVPIPVTGPLDALPPLVTAGPLMLPHGRAPAAAPAGPQVGAPAATVGLPGAAVVAAGDAPAQARPAGPGSTAALPGAGAAALFDDAGKLVRTAFLVARREAGLEVGDPLQPGPTAPVSADGKAVAELAGGVSAFVERVEPARYQDFLDSAVGGDARVLPIRRGPGGVRCRTWTSVADEVREESFEDWPLPGPRSARWCLTFLRREGLNLEGHHERFRAVTKADGGQWGVQEHYQLSQMLQFMGDYDQYDMTNSATAESMFRRLQTIEFSYAEKVREAEAKATGGRLSLEEQAIFSGLTRHHTSLMICPQLLEHVRAEAEREASLAKNLRKAREERAALRKSG